MKFQIDFGRKTNKSDELTLSVAENSRICDNPHENLPTQVQNCANSTAAQSLCSEISVTVPQMTARPGRNRVPGMVSMDDLMNMSFDDMKSHMHSTPHASFRSTSAAPRLDYAERTFAELDVISTGPAFSGRRVRSSATPSLGAHPQDDLAAASYESLLQLDEGNVRRGVSESERRRKITVVSAGRSDVNNDCNVCLCKYKLGERLSRLPCGHIYHERCLSPWLDSNRSCPVCRKEV